MYPAFAASRLCRSAHLHSKLGQEYQERHDQEQVGVVLIMVQEHQELHAQVQVDIVLILEHQERHYQVYR